METLLEIGNWMAQNPGRFLAILVVVGWFLFYLFDRKW